MSSCGWASDIYMPRHPWYYTCVLLSLSLVVSYRRTKYIASDATPTTPHRLPFPSGKSTMEFLGDNILFHW